MKNLILNPESDDDDITMQDLVAMETMEGVADDASEDDQFFNNINSGTNPLEPFMNAILQQSHQNPGFTCDKCGIHFHSLLEFRGHQELSCTEAKRSKGKKSSKSRAKNSAPCNEEVVEIKQEVKSEAVESALQPVLGATGDGHKWKCNQCKVVFETGPDLLEHLDLIRKAEFKCSSCHMILRRSQNRLHSQKEISHSAQGEGGGRHLHPGHGQD